MGEPAPVGGWPLLLTSAARTWSVVLIVLGAVGLVVYSILLPVALQSTSTAIARQQVDSAYNTASRAAQTFGDTIQTCTRNAQSSGDDPLTCYEQSANTVAAALELYASQLAAVAYPASAQAQATAAEQAAQTATSALRQLAAAPDVQSFSSTLQDGAFLAKLDAVDSTYNQLHQALTG